MIIKHLVKSAIVGAIAGSLAAALGFHFPNNWQFYAILGLAVFCWIYGYFTGLKENE